MKLSAIQERLADVSREFEKLPNKQQYKKFEEKLEWLFDCAEYQQAAFVEYILRSLKD
jgi:hypothetical protein